MYDVAMHELEASRVLGQGKVMISVQDLQPQCFLILRMRTQHVIGARSHLEILRFLESKFSDDIELICKSYSGFRRIGGDGNCYYRAIAFGLMEQLVVDNSREHFLTLRDVFEQIVYPPDSEEAVAHAELLDCMIAAVQGHMWLTTEQLQVSFLSRSNNIDLALVRVCR